MSLRILSLGAGVQSSAVLLMALEGELPPIDAAVFADTGWEPPAVYAWLDVLEALAAAGGVPIHRVQQGNLREEAVADAGDYHSVPLFIRGDDGSHGMARRQCTSYYKVRPIRFEIRRLMRGAGVKRAAQVFGISAEEVGRMRDPDVRYLDHEYPLVDAGLRRRDCQVWLEARGHRPAKSACIGCPFHSDAAWRQLRDEDPAGWAEAVEFDRAIRHGSFGAAAREPLRGTAYLHRQRVPLDEVDLTTPEDHGQLAFEGDGFAAECEGMCGV